MSALSFGVKLHLWFIHLTLCGHFLITVHGFLPASFSPNTPKSYFFSQFWQGGQTAAYNPDAIVLKRLMTDCFQCYFVCILSLWLEYQHSVFSIPLFKTTTLMHDASKKGISQILFKEGGHNTKNKNKKETKRIFLLTGKCVKKS